MRNKFYMFLAALLLVATTSNAQQQTAIFLESRTPTGVQESFYKQVSERNLVDDHIYTCGATYNNSGTYDILLSKYTLSNVLVWTETYSGSGNYSDYATDLAFDSDGNIIVVGAIGISTYNYDCVTLKYDTDGDLVYSTTYAGSAGGLDGLTCVVVDANDNVYVSGGTYYGTSQLTNMLLIKYDTSLTQLWLNTYNNSTYNLQESSFRILLSGAYVNCYGALQTQANPVVWKLCNAQYLQSNGTLNGSSTSNGDDEDFAEIKDVIIESNYFVTACGYQNVSGQGRNLKVTKFNQTLTSIWNYSYNNASNGNDIANSIELNGSLYVGGSTTLADGSTDFFTCKLNYGNGNVSWTNIFDGGTGENDEVIDLATDGTGQLYLCGNSYKVGNSDYYVAKLKNTTGALLASNRFNGAYNLNDVVSNMVVTSTGDIYVAGQEGVTSNTGPTYKYALTKWSEKTVWVPLPSNGYSSSGGYITNKEQLRNEDGSGNETVKFYNQNHRVATYVNDTLVAYQLVQAMDSTDQDTTFRVDMKFTKGSPNAKVFPFSERKEYHNYYLGHMSGASERTAIVNDVIKSGVYTNTDVVYTHSPSGFRHLIVARSGSPTSDFEMTFNGQSSLSVDGSGKLVIATSIGNIIFTKAKAYTMHNTTGVLTLLGWQPSYSISGSAVSFTSFGSWSGTLVLEYGEVAGSSVRSVQDQNLDWSTMFGGSSDDIFINVDSNTNNDVFAIGHSKTPIINNIGQIITSYVANQDAIIVKFNAQCEAEFLVYYGGSDIEIVRGLDVSDNNGDIYMVGTTGSTDLLDASNLTMEDNSLNGITDGFYSKFNSNGALTQHTYVGGDGWEHCSAVTHIFFEPTLTDIVYYSGYTSEGAGWATMIEQTNSTTFSYAGGTDGFIFKRSGESQEIIWSTFFGSGSNERIFSMALLRGSPIIVGVTSATEYSEDLCTEPTDNLFPSCSNNSWTHDFINNNGTTGTNSFIAYFGDNGSIATDAYDELQWSTYLCSFPELMEPLNWMDVCVSGEGWLSADEAKVYVTGQVQLPPNEEDFDFPFVQSGWHQSSPGGGGSDGFLLGFNSFDNTFTQFRGTVFGSEAQEGGFGIDVTEDGIVFICGQSFIDELQSEIAWCSNPTNSAFPMCDGEGLFYIEDNNAPSEPRAFIAAFLDNGEMLWSTAYGAGNQNTAFAVTTNDSKVWIVGRSNAQWTPEEFIAGDGSDYFRNVIAGDVNIGQEATIARFDIPSIVSIQELTNEPASEILIYPNPTNGITTVAWNKTYWSDSVQLRLFDSLGQVIFEIAVSHQAFYSLDLSLMAAGVYTVQISGSGLLTQSSLVKF